MTPVVSRVPRAGAVVGALLLALLSGCGATGQAGGDDAALASCLSAPRRPVLVEAARSLALPDAPRDDPAAVAAWRVARPAEFDRACAAITPPAAADPVTSGVLSLLGGFVGALLTSGATLLVANATRRSETVDALRDAADQLSATANGMILQRTGKESSGPALAQLLDRVAALEGALLRARPRARRGAPVDASLRRVRAVPDALGGAWPQAGRAPSVKRGSEVTQELGRLRADVEDVAAGIGAWWSRRGHDGGGGS